MAGKPDNAGGPLPGLLYTRESVYAGGLAMFEWDARRSGRPGDKYMARLMETGQCRRPSSIWLGSPTMREAHWMDLHTHGCRSMPKSFWSVNGKPDRAGGPIIITRYDSWKPVHAGGHIVYNREARQCRRPIGWIYIQMEAGPCRRPLGV